MSKSSTKLNLRWLVLAGLVTIGGCIAVWRANWEAKGADPIVISVFREAPRTPVADALISLTAEDNLVFANFYLTRGQAPRFIVALSHLDPTSDSDSVANGSCEAWGGTEWRSFAGKTDHTLTLTYLRESAWPPSALVNHVWWRSSTKPTLVMIETPADSGDKISLHCVLTPVTTKVSFVKRQYQIEPWQILMPLGIEVSDVLAKQIGASFVEDRAHAKLFSRAHELQISGPPVEDDAAPDFRTLDGSMPITSAWNDERAARLRDILLIIIGALFGTAGACFVEVLRPYMDKSH